MITIKHNTHLVNCQSKEIIKLEPSRIKICLIENIVITLHRRNNMIGFIIEILAYYGIRGNYSGLFANIIALVVVMGVAFAAYLISKKMILNTANLLAAKTPGNWISIFIERKVFTRVSYLIPGMVVLIFSPIFGDYYTIINKLVSACILFVTMIIVSAFVEAMAQIYLSIDNNAANKPIQSYVEVIKIFVYIVSSLAILALAFDTSLWTLLSGIGALTAVIMLVFKDTLLGLVASVQISAYNLVRIGDWIEVSKYGADGTVIEINLNTVKIRNWDNTITTIPTYTIISDSFKNWRGMEESEGRRIKKVLLIDTSTIKYFDETELKKYQAIIDNAHGKLDKLPFRGSGLTNIALFRMYFLNYLRNLPEVNHDMTLIVRALELNQFGLPIEIYFYSRQKNFSDYEALQAKVLEHALAVLPEFELGLVSSKNRP